MHWATLTDIGLLAQALDIGFLVFADQLESGGRECLVRLGESQRARPYYVALWYQDSVHFRAAELQLGTTCLYTRSWSRCSLPVELQRLMV